MSVTGSGKPARCSSGPASPSCRNGATRAKAPPLTWASAAEERLRAVRSACRRRARPRGTGHLVRRWARTRARKPGTSLTTLQVENRDDEVVAGSRQRQALGIDQRMPRQRASRRARRRTGRRRCGRSRGSTRGIGRHDQRLLECAGHRQQPSARSSSTSRVTKSGPGRGGRDAAAIERAVEDDGRGGHLNRQTSRVAGWRAYGEPGAAACQNARAALCARPAASARAGGCCSTSSIRRSASAATGRWRAPTRSAPSASARLGRSPRRFARCSAFRSRCRLGPMRVSAEAIADPPPFERARSAVIYNEVARTLVSAAQIRRPAGAGAVLRPADGRRRARVLGGRARPRAGAAAPRRGSSSGATTNRRNWRGRWHGSPGCRVDPAWSARTRRTRQQVGLSADARQRNVAGAFCALIPSAGARLGGRRVVLVDDVITTGATVKAVTKALHKAGIDKVDVISFARVVVGERLAAMSARPISAVTANPRLTMPKIEIYTTPVVPLLPRRQVAAGREGRRLYRGRRLDPRQARGDDRARPWPPHRAADLHRRDACRRL